MHSNEAAREHIFADISRTLPIVSAKLGVDAGLVGAAAVIFAEQNARQITLMRQT